MSRPVNLLIKNEDRETVMKLEKGCDIALGGIFCLPEMKLIDKSNDKDLG